MEGRGSQTNSISLVSMVKEQKENPRKPTLYFHTFRRHFRPIIIWRMEGKDKKGLPNYATWPMQIRTGEFGGS